MRKVFIALCVLFAASASPAADFSIGLSGTTIAVDYTSPPVGQGLEYAVGWLRNVDNGNVISGGLQVSQQVNPTFKVALGARLFSVFSDVKNATAVTLGGQVVMAIPNVQNVYVGLHAWYAPSVTCSNGSKNFQNLGVSLGYRVMNNAEIFAAYRSIRIDFGPLGKHKVEDGAVLGLKLIF